MFFSKKLPCCASFILSGALHRRLENGDAGRLRVVGFRVRLSFSSSVRDPGKKNETPFRGGQLLCMYVRRTSESLLNIIVGPKRVM